MAHLDRKDVNSERKLGKSGIKRCIELFSIFRLYFYAYLNLFGTVFNEFPLFVSGVLRA